MMMRLDMKNAVVASHYNMWQMGGYASYEAMLEALIKEIVNNLGDSQ